MFNGARILVAPLDWGLGHAARCIPLVRTLLEHDATPVLGADGGPLMLLRDEFPTLEHVRIPGVTVRYARGRDQRWDMIRQFPRLLRGIGKEHAHAVALRPRLRLDAVISDQRFGIRSTEVPSVIITHQLFPITPMFQAPLRRLNLRLLGRFDRCWIIDHADAPGLSGELGHGPTLPSNARYIGPQSRFSPHRSKGSGSGRIVAVISGPEPQRTQLERILLDQLRDIPGRHLLVRGLPSAVQEERTDITLVPHLSSDRLADALASADLIVSRSGYTTLMDLHALGRPALLIPTPGQSEQEYLARLHEARGHFIMQSQEKVDMREALAGSKELFSPVPSPHPAPLERALKDLADIIQRRKAVTFSRT